MTADTRFATEALRGAAAPPLANGEPAFASPAEARLFGMAHALVSSGVFDWAAFREALIVAIAAAERELDAASDARFDSPDSSSEAMVNTATSQPGAASGFDYYTCFARALSTLLGQRKLVDEAELHARIHALALRPHGHDHGSEGSEGSDHGAHG